MTWFDKVRLYLIYTIAVTLIVLAVCFSLLRAVLPHATGYVEDVEQALTQQIGLPVKIASMDAGMYWLVPQLKLVDVVIHDKDNQRELLRLDEAIFSLAFVDSILQWSPTVGDVSLVGADLYIERYADNRWKIQGVEFGGDTAESSSNNSSSELIAAIQNTSFSLLDSDIHWKDYRLRKGQLDFIGANIFIEELLGDHSLEMDLQLPKVYGEFFRLIVKTDGDIAHLSEADFDVYLQGESINLGQWFSVLGISELPSVKGIFNGELWLSTEDKVLSQLALDASVEQLNVARQKHGAFSLDNVAGMFEWEKTDDGWNFNSRDIRMVKQAVAWQESASVAIVQDDEGLSLAATYLRSQDLIAIANIFFDDEQLNTVKNYRLNSLAGDFYNSVIFSPANDASNIELSTTFENAEFYVPDSDISFRGIDGVLAYAEGQARLELLSEMVVMDFGDLFRQPLDANLVEGVVFIEREGSDWQVSSNDLYLLNSDIEINTRLKLVADEQGTVFADIQSDFINGMGSNIYKYYPVSIMSDDLLGWLDMAITDGLVESGSFIIRGDLNRFPYGNNDGVMQVVFDTNYLTLKFLDGWPSLNNLSSHIRFHNSSMTITEASGYTYRGEMTNAKAFIPDLDAPRLFVNGQINAPAEDLQQYVWDSGLNDILGAAMKRFQASGEIDLDLELEIPLDNGDEVLSKGALLLKDNELYFPVMHYVFDNVSGSLSFEGDQLNASGITALFEGAPVSIDVMSIAVPDIDVMVSDEFTMDTTVADMPDDDKARSETVFYIKGRLPIDGILKRFEWIPEPWVTGVSDWDVAVHLPKDVEDYSVRIDMQSQLEGVGINLTDAVSKAADVLLPIALEIKTLDDALQVDVKSDDRFTLLATRNGGDIWDFVVDSNLIRGAGKFAEDLNKNSTASLNLEYIDLLTLFKSTKKNGDSISLSPTFFPSLNFKTRVLLWDDWEFNDVNLETSWHSHGMLIDKVSLQGPSLQVKGSGSWLTSWQNKDESSFKFIVNSDDFGHTMSALNLSKNMKRCEQTATVDWQWPGAPYQFSWQTVQGSSHFKMKDGEVKELDPGAGGRILGLFNVFKLADRLTLDFSDVAGEGFVFDSIEGDIEFDNGYAFSQNIEISAAAANMKLQGRVGMVDKDYDLMMKVKPRSSAAAFTGGTLVGGPVLGAGLVLINKLLGLEKGSYDEYEITGPWDDPQVKKIGNRSEKENSEE